MSLIRINDKKIQEFLPGVIAGLSFIFMLVGAAKNSFWMDDMAQIDIAWQGSLQEMILRNIELDNNPPLTHFLCYFWIRIMPYGTRWLKLFNIIWVSLGIFWIGKIGKKYLGLEAGIFSSVLSASTMGFITLAAYTYRPYGMLFFLSTLVLDYYLKSRINNRAKEHIMFTICMILFAYTHYFGVIVCVALGVVDLVLCYKKKIAFKCFVSYIVAAFLYLPWIFLVFKTSISRIQNFWPARPDGKALYDALYEMMGYDTYLTIFCAFFFLVSCFSILKMIDRNTSDRERQELLIVLLMNWCVIFVVGLVFIVSRYGEKVSSLFVSRYFICIMPQFLLGIGYCIQKLYRRFMQTFGRYCWLRRSGQAFVILVCIGLMAKCEMRNLLPAASLQPFEEVADYLMQQEDIYDEDVLVFNTCNDVQHGWDYYLTHKGERKTIQATWQYLNDEDLQNINKIYVVTMHLPYGEDAESLILKNGFNLVNEEVLPVKIYER